MFCVKFFVLTWLFHSNITLQGPWQNIMRVLLSRRIQLYLLPTRSGVMAYKSFLKNHIVRNYATSGTSIQGIKFDSLFLQIPDPGNLCWGLLGSENPTNSVKSPGKQVTLRPSRLSIFYTWLSWCLMDVAKVTIEIQIMFHQFFIF